MYVCVCEYCMYVLVLRVIIELNSTAEIQFVSSELTLPPTVCCEYLLDYF